MGLYKGIKLHFKKSIIFFITFVLWFVVFYKPEAKAESDQQFVAGVVAEDPPFPGIIKVLGKYKQCKVIAAEKEDQQRSACYLYKNKQKIWEVKSFGAVCHTKCR